MLEKKIIVSALDPAEKRRLTNEEYEFIFQRVPRFCVDILLVKDGAVLLAKRDIEPFKGLWALPGGMVRYKETIDQAIDRIGSSELGIFAGKRELIGCIDNHDDGPWLQSISNVFVVRRFEGMLRGSEEGREFQFFSAVPEGMQPYHAAFVKEHWSRIVG